MDLQQIVTRAWEDEAFKQALLKNPKATLEQVLGITFPPEVEIFVHEQTPTQIHSLLPMKPVG